MSMEKLFTDKGVAIAEAELRRFANMTPPICIHERKTRRPPYCKPFEQFQECALVVLDLVVNRQRAEIERLNEVVERLQKHNRALCMLEKMQIDRIESEARKEFAKRLKKNLHESSDSAFTIATVFREINDLLKEMESKRYDNTDTKS